jgi:predicted ATPase with chaperone activity
MRLKIRFLWFQCFKANGRKLQKSNEPRPCGHALSPRACHRILKVSRTLADLDRAAAIGTAHLAEAISYHGSSARAEPRY